MITHLNGKLVEKNPTFVVLECSGVGYYVNISLNTFSKIPDRENLRLLTHLQIKEDAHTLFGFMDEGERAMFRLLISISGIGASTARTMLSSLSPEQVRDAILSDNVGQIQSVKGIGAKTAQRVIIELKDKVLKLPEMGEVSTVTNNTNKDEALSALEVLGFARKQAQKVVDKIAGEDPSLKVEELIKLALKNL
ncbi:Holliday junction branch migration protein RuvA [Sediminicola luteus]|uniref:Holliday junction branch migration complex subunit RuvA n=1 Tax=Sediminicola luteus TaxID=319238 RepID=A0A2A4G667_9FLAO|nr:Holliday junction branch migration protein RuvA [Sediminicola luteus]PCE63232.1 Holliday junction branch migration protein RuvA [Sediminicola luteus]